MQVTYEAARTSAWSGGKTATTDGQYGTVRYGTGIIVHGIERVVQYSTVQQHSTVEEWEVVEVEAHRSANKPRRRIPARKHGPESSFVTTL